MKALHYFLFAATSLLAPHLSQAQATQAQTQTDAYGDPLTATQLAATLGGAERLTLGTQVPIAADSRNVSTSTQIGDRNEVSIDQRYDATTAINQRYNEAHIQQIGDRNTALLTQNGAGNSATIYQTLNAAGVGTSTGTGNTIDFSQTGNGNKSTLTQQGDNNKITGAVIGDGNTVDITQRGNGNKVIGGQIRETGMIYGVTQIGNDHELNQISSTLFPKGYNVEMVGQGIKLTIEQSRVLPTVKP